MEVTTVSHWGWGTPPGISRTIGHNIMKLGTRINIVKTSKKIHMKIFLGYHGPALGGNGPLQGYPKLFNLII